MLIPLLYLASLRVASWGDIFLQLGKTFPPVGGKIFPSSKPVVPSLLPYGCSSYSLIFL